MIEIENLGKRFGDLVAVKNINLTVRPGEILGFLGPNGAGKTTTVKILSGLMSPTAGRAAIAGHDIVLEPEAAKRCLALVPDEPFVYPKLTGLEFMAFMGDLYEVSRAAQTAEIPRYLEMFDLTAMGNELLESYSHGMRQKLVLASVLLRKPKVLLLDEPMVGLDPKSARMVKHILKELADNGTAIFMCTHILEIAEKLCTRIGIMYEGEIIQMGTIEQLRERSGSPLEDSSGRRISLEDIFLTLTGGSGYSQL
ncbi:MAG: ABC transporter ATP-binding protein [Elusimicrobiaceae bacterium]|nr:ABC transporter ATP-binding protein [Elusimicrobiaceae bacterium]